MRAQQLITEITERGHVPIIAGGTGLYIQSLIYDYPLIKKKFLRKRKRSEGKDGCVRNTL